MSLLDKASLVVTPNSYKESKLYSVVPNTTLGDMDVVRATTATRVNSAGLIEVVPRNLLTYSNDFSNASWQKQNCTITPNYANNPFVTQNASLIQDSVGTSTQYRISQSIGSNNNVFTLSLYVKRLSGTKNAYIDLGPYTAYFNFTDEIIVSASGIASFTKLDNGWYRINLTSPTNYNISTVYLGFANVYNETYTSTGGNQMLFYASQLENFATATEYFPTTTRLNIPRIDYTNGSCPSLLVEPQRTNLVPNPFAYTGSGVAFNSTVVNSPISGGLSTRITKNEAAGTLRYASQICSATALSSLTAYTISAFFKYDGYNVQTSMEYNNSNQWGTTSWSQLINIASTGITLGTSSACTSTIQNYGNGWYRVNIRVTTGAVILGTPPVNYLIQVASSLSTGQGFLHTAVQLEVGAYATSYVPTVASSVTRNADVISKTGISSLIGQTEGTLFCEINLPNPLSSGGKTIVVIGTSGNRIYISKEGTTTNFFQLATQSASGFNFINSSVITTSKVKFAIAYKGGNNAFYVNGSLISSASAVANPTSFSNLLIGDSTPETNTDIKINSVQLYKTRLSNSELQSLTTL